MSEIGKVSVLLLSLIVILTALNDFISVVWKYDRETKELWRKYFVKFIQPYILRFKHNGLTDKQIYTLCSKSLELADVNTGVMPGDILRGMVERIEDGWTVEEILDHFNEKRKSVEI